MALIFHFKCTLKLSFAIVSIWVSLVFFVWLWVSQKTCRGELPAKTEATLNRSIPINTRKAVTYQIYRYLKSNLINQICSEKGGLLHLSEDLHISLYQIALVFMCLQSKSFKNTAGKGEIARNEQFLLFPQCFLHFWRTSVIFIRLRIVVCKLFQFGRV